MLAKWPQRAMVSSRTWGTTLASRERSDGGVNTSLSPRVASTGQRMALPQAKVVVSDSLDGCGEAGGAGIERKPADHVAGDGWRVGE